MALRTSLHGAGGGIAGVWLFVIAVALVHLFRLLHPHAGRVGPHMLIGWPNRFLVLAYHVWLQIVASYVRRMK
jgi:hypothetical protein